MARLDEVAEEKRQGVENALKRIAYSAIRSYERDNVVRLPDSARQDMEKALRDVWKNAVAWRAPKVLNEFRSYGFEHLETKNDERSLFDRVLDFFMEVYGAQKITAILATSRDEILRMVRVGVDDGLSTRQIAKNMREAVPELSANRSLMIARTETHGSGNFAQQAVARESRRPLMKVWNATEDERTRSLGAGDEFGHRSMDGTKVKLSEPYFVPTKFGTREALMFPGDPNGSPGNVINCRCTETYERAERVNG